MKKYTLGFVFKPDFSEVLLVHKNRPTWQAGQLNGVGGKIEAGEESVDGLVREVLEETGVATNKDDWTCFGAIQGEDWRVDLYALIYFAKASDFSTTTDEKVEWFRVDKLPDDILDNLAWMIPLAIDFLKNKEIKSCVVDYR